MRKATRVAAILSLLVASCTCPFAKCKKTEVLHPGMTPAAGSPEKPAAAVGETPAEPWSATTIEAAVAGKPNPGKVVTLTGEIIDCSCYWQLGKHGAKHKECGQKCARAGEPIGLLAADGTVHLLMAEEHHPRRDGQTTLREKLIEHMADIVSVTGTESTLNGQKALFVSGFVKK